MTVVIRNLKLALPPGGDRPYAVDGVSFELSAGKILCVVGESGSGKSMCAHALMGLLPDTVRAEAGEILFEGQNLLSLSPAEWLALRGRGIAMVFQEPMTALNPLMRIGKQIAEMFEAHDLLTPKERRQKALALIREVGLPDPERIVRAYPHQLSGGQRQRAMIAMALALEPAVLVADEPTTALDVTTQAQILKLIRDLQRRRNMAVMFITHDFGVVAEIADRVVVLQHGKVVEQGTADDVLLRAQHPYTRALLAAVPTLQPPQRAPLLDRSKAVEVIGLGKTYVSGGGWFRAERRVQAAREVSFDIFRGETLGLVGESGSGKSSVARLVMRLIEPDAGTVRSATSISPGSRERRCANSAAGSRWFFRIRSPRSIRAAKSATSSPMDRLRMASIRRRRESVPANCSAWSASMPARWSAFRMNSPAGNGNASA